MLLVTRVDQTPLTVPAVTFLITHGVRVKCDGEGHLMRVGSGGHLMSEGERDVMLKVT